jgi:hypothetical protein
MATLASKTKPKPNVSPLSDQGPRLTPFATGPWLISLEMQQNYNQLQGDLQALAAKIGELEQEADEHGSGTWPI